MAADILEDLSVKHWLGRGPLPEPTALWLQTCLRTVAISRGPSGLATHSAPDACEVYHQSEAYRFLLQMACGLHSPIVGETEVAGQVREAFAQFEHPDHQYWYVRLHSFLNEDMKRVRERHLIGLGSQSYGSFVRRELSEVSSIDIIGAGPLSQEVTTWLLKRTERAHKHSTNKRTARRSLTLWVRDLERAQCKAPWAFARSAQADGLGVRLLGSSRQGDTSDQVSGLVVAAPISSADLRDWLCRGFSDRERERLVVIDLRGGLGPPNPQMHREAGVLRWISLEQVFAEISLVQQNAALKKQFALDMIEDLVDRRMRSMSIRPFGWDDVCG